MSTEFIEANRWREPEQPHLNKHEQALSDAASLAQNLVAGLLGFDAALTLLDDERVLSFVPPILPGQLVPNGIVNHMGSQEGHAYDFIHYLKFIRAEPNRTITKRLWASNSLIRIGEELKRQNYFDRHPNFEMIRHLRNSVAHGETFVIFPIDQLKKFPANLRSENYSLEITSELNGSKLYDFVSAGDICSVIQFAGIRLNDMALKRHVE